MITKEYFQEYWQNHYNNIPPIGYILRNQFFNDRWFRIHSLPNSKRYADNNKEMQIILDRQNTLIDDLIGKKNEYLLVFLFYSEHADFELTKEIPNIILLDTIRLDTVSSEYYEDEYYLIAGFVNSIWESGSVDRYLSRIANEGKIINFDNSNDNSCSVLIMNMKQNRIIAPYDGGVDIFLNTQSERDFYKSKYKEWLSFTESGL